jgi:hypothetical protein
LRFGRIPSNLDRFQTDQNAPTLTPLLCRSPVDRRPIWPTCMGAVISCAADNCDERILNSTSRQLYHHEPATMTISISSSAQWRQTVSSHTIVVVDCKSTSHTGPPFHPIPRSSPCGWLAASPSTNQPTPTTQSTPTGAARAR